jgi:hypothetical protein
MFDTTLPLPRHAAHGSGAACSSIVESAIARQA